MNLLVTGGTGAVGSEVVAQFRVRHPGSKLTFVCRRPVAIEGSEVIVSDLSPESLQNDRLVAAVRAATHVAHIAADINWNQTSEDARRNNIDPTEVLIKLVATHNPGLARFSFVSTAYVDSIVPPVRLRHQVEDGGKRFNNWYEWSKWEAEKMVRSSELPWVVVRPSLVVGHSQTGETARYNGIFKLLRILARGICPLLPANPKGIADIVPCDLVGKAICDGFTSPDHVRRTVWIANGTQAPSVAVMIRTCVDGVNAARTALGLPRVAEPALIPLERYMRLYRPLLTTAVHRSRDILEALESFLPYLSSPAPLSVPAGAVVYDPPPGEAYFTHSVTSWCERNPSVLAGVPKKWSRTDLVEEFRS